ncbi:hypothetical protein [Moorena producens]|uniref:hypothetical protein n=1 Tax=Moorena producens TaxID=1155739 RepID=UPI003C7952F4
MKVRGVVFKHPTLAYWPRDRVQPFNLQPFKPWPIGHAIAFNPSNLQPFKPSTLQTFTLQTFNPSNLQTFKPSNLGLLATRSRSTLHP